MGPLEKMQGTKAGDITTVQQLGEHHTLKHLLVCSVEYTCK